MTGTQTQEAQSEPQHHDHKNIYAALLQAKKDMGPIYKNASNPAYRSKYADLANIVEVVEGPLQDNDILLRQPLSNRDGRLYVSTILHHVPSDTSTESEIEVVCKDPSDPQKVGGAITYYRRYDLMAELGIAPEDDDGNMAAAPKAVQTESRPAVKTSTSTQPAPPQEETVHCEVQGCKNTVRKAVMERNRANHEGHVICQFHSANGSWKAALSAKTNPAEGKSIPDDATPDLIDAAERIFLDQNNPTATPTPDGSTTPTA